MIGGIDIALPRFRQDERKSGTLSGKGDPALYEYYYMQNKVPGKVELVVNNLPIVKTTSSERPLIVDVGCANGEILQRIATYLEPKGEQYAFVGVDSNAISLTDARKANKFPESVSYEKKDALEMDFGENKVAVFNCGNVLHELYTKGTSSERFTNQPVRTAFRNMRRQLMEGGRIIIREAAKPENPDELLTMEFTPAADGKMHFYEDTANNQAKEADLLTLQGNVQALADALKKIPVAQLSNYGRFLRFSMEYVHLKDPQQRKALLVQLGEGKYRMPAWLVGEYARKRTFVKHEGMWDAEMDEQNGVFTAGDLTHLAQEAGFSRKDIHLYPVMEQNYYAKITDSMGILLKDSGGRAVDFMERFQSHVYGVLTKANKGKSFWGWALGRFAKKKTQQDELQVAA